MGNRGIQICTLVLALAVGLSGVAIRAEASQITSAAQRAAAQASKRSAEQAAQRAAVRAAPRAAAKKTVPDKVVGIYRTPLCKPTAPCPLPEHVSNTFVGAYEKKIVSQDTVLYRVYADPARTLGAPKSTAPQKQTGKTALTEPQYSYWSRHDQRGLQAAIDDGLEVSKYGNTAGRQVVIRVPKGTTIYEGIARGDVSSVNQASKIGAGVRHNPTGGGNQIVIPVVPPSWISKP
ncbi:MAG: hypothetical protein GZ085_03730 [Sulfuriferula multivorans]|uniref:Uncharacterized protein n=1 Tax=Sulfuriferula multivorans TaxID=1559896 RepID=A0A7C9JVX5_9PROT|nr:hypothetical protein [Sulfuriferula multivorans]